VNDSQHTAPAVVDGREKCKELKLSMTIPFSESQESEQGTHGDVEVTLQEQLRDFVRNVFHPVVSVDVNSNFPAAFKPSTSDSNSIYDLLKNADDENNEYQNEV
jgi:hypothetical protein